MWFDYIAYVNKKQKGGSAVGSVLQKTAEYGGHAVAMCDST